MDPTPGVVLPYKVGFTGTQEGITSLQHMRLWALLHNIMVKHGEREFHHGDCVGADKEAFDMAKLLAYKTVAHPGPHGPKRAYTQSDLLLPPRPYLTRNDDIAYVCDQLIACPKEPTEQRRSGTWATVRRARKHGKAIFLILPDGTGIWDDKLGVMKALVTGVQ